MTIARILVLISLSIGSTFAFGQRPARTAQSAPVAVQTITVKTEPGAVVWLDSVRRGTADSTGSIVLQKVKSGRHVVRVRATGYMEKAVPITTAQKVVTVMLVRTSDPAELAFQQAEDAREKAHDDAARRNAADLYRKAILLKPTNAAAHLGLARVLLDLNDYKGAQAQIEQARRYRPSYAEASAVEGRIKKSSGYMDNAIASYKRSIREAGGFQPEAHTGLAIVYEEQSQDEDAAKEFRTAIDQLADTEPVLYQLLGAVYEKQEKYKEAVAAYEKYLELAPNGTYASAIRSMIDQLRKQAAGEQIIP
jgi:tetratricopeptide (TPR) repeat protein